MLQELENIDDDAEVAGIPIVKLEDKLLAKTVGVFALPAIVFFRLDKQKMSKEEVVVTFETAANNDRHLIEGRIYRNTVHEYLSQGVIVQFAFFLNQCGFY